MSELISLREAGRRLGVSDVAVGKAIKTGRVQIAAHKEGSGRPLVSWPEIAEQWSSNTDATMRSHSGAQGGKLREKKPVFDIGKVDVPIKAILKNKNKTQSQKKAKEQKNEQKNEVEPPTNFQAASSSAMPGGVPPLAQSRAIQAAYAARLAKIEHDEKTGKLISIDIVKTEAFKTHRMVRDALLNLPDRLAPAVCALTDISDIHAALTEEIHAALKRLSNDIFLASTKT